MEPAALRLWARILDAAAAARADSALWLVSAGPAADENLRRLLGPARAARAVLAKSADFADHIHRWGLDPTLQPQTPPPCRSGFVSLVPTLVLSPLPSL